MWRHANGKQYLSSHHTSPNTSKEMSASPERREASPGDRRGDSPAPRGRSPGGRDDSRDRRDGSRDRRDDSRDRQDSSRNARKGSGEVCAASLLVRNLSYRVTSDEIRRMMTKYGEVRDVYIPMDHYTKRPRGFCFVEFFDGRDARYLCYYVYLEYTLHFSLRDAMENLDGSELDGRDITVVFAKENRKTPDQMRRAQPPPRRDSRDYDRRDRSRDRYNDRDRRRSRSRDRRDRGRDRDRSRSREDDRRRRYVLCN